MIINDFKNLQFFDKVGQNHQFEIVDGIYKGGINLSRISVNLIETEHIFILEEFLSGFGKPKSKSGGHSIIELDIRKMPEDSILRIGDRTNNQNYLFEINNYNFLNELILDIQTVLGVLSPYNIEITKDILRIEIIHENYYNLFGYDYKMNPIEIIDMNLTGIDYEMEYLDYYPRFRVRLDESVETKFFFYNVIKEENIPFITKFEEMDKILEFDSTGIIENKASIINLGFQSDEEVFELNNIIIEYSNRVGIFERIGEIEVYGESVEEDDRFKYLLKNFGKVIPENDYFCFRESDIKEDNIDYEILNSKRKEYLVQIAELDPYIGSYKGLLNALNFYGYSDLRVNEFWLDLSKSVGDSQSHVLVDIENKNKDITRSKNFSKTNMFSLVYDLNLPTGEEDEFGIPKVVENFEYSFEEILIKLFCLKNILKRDYMPPNSKIVDITGQGNYYDVYKIRTWNDKHTSVFVDSGIDIDWTTENSFGLISDLRDLIYGKYNECVIEEYPEYTYKISDLSKISDLELENPLTIFDKVYIEDLNYVYKVVNNNISIESSCTVLQTDKGLFYTTIYGGNYNLGGLYFMNSDTGIIKLIYSFNLLEGWEPSGNIIKDNNNNKIYVETINGSTNGFGSLLEIDCFTGNSRIVLAFDNISSGYSTGILSSTADDKYLLDCWIYLVHSFGGLYGNGTIIKINITNGQYFVLQNISTVTLSAPGRSKGQTFKYGSDLFIFVDNQLYIIDINNSNLTQISLPVNISANNTALRNGFRFSNNFVYMCYGGLSNVRILKYDMQTKTYQLFYGGIGMEIWNGFEFNNLPHFINLVNGDIFSMDNLGNFTNTGLQISNNSNIGLYITYTNDKIIYWSGSIPVLDKLYQLDLNTGINDLLIDITQSFYVIDNDNFIDINGLKALQRYEIYNECENEYWNYDFNNGIMNSIPGENPIIANTSLSKFVNLDENVCPYTRKYDSVGFEIDVSTKSFELNWNEADFTWESLISAPNATWETLGFFDFYELEWEILGSEGYAKEMNYRFVDRGRIEDYKDYKFVVPYIGKYTITLRGIELSGNISYETKHSFIEVDMYNSDFVLITNIIDIEKLETWKDFENIKWSEISGTWNNPKITDSKFDEAFSQWGSLKLNRYFDSDYKYLNDITGNYETDISNSKEIWNKYIDFRNMTWEKLEDITFSEMKNINWRALEFEPYKQAGFEILDVFQGNPSLTINSTTFNLGLYTNPGPQPQQEWDNLALNLENTFEDWEFTARPLNHSHYIHAVYKNYNYKPQDYEISVQDWTLSEIEYSNGYYTFEDIFISRSGLKLGVGTPFLLVPDSSKIPGKTEIFWKIYNNKTGEKLVDIKNMWLHCIIPQKGIFDIECIIKDSNGNTKKIIKKGFINSI